jgi:hypothetical protein
MVDEELVSAKVVSEKLNIPTYALYRMVKDKRVTAYPMPGETWHKRRLLGFRISEVRKALGVG